MDKQERLIQAMILDGKNMLRDGKINYIDLNTDKLYWILCGDLDSLYTTNQISQGIDEIAEVYYKNENRIHSELKTYDNIMKGAV